MKVSEAIEKLTIKRDDALHFQKMYAPGELGWTGNESKAIAYSTAINTLQQIDEPQDEKVEVPDFVAEWYEEHKCNLDNSIRACVNSITQFHSREIDLNDFEKWFSVFNNEPIETLIRMKDGYTVKPKRWVVRAGEYHATYVDSLTITSEKSHHTISEKDRAYCFTNKSKAEAVATLVEGSVEEL